MLILRCVFKDAVSRSVVLRCVREGSVSKTMCFAIAALDCFTTAPCITNETSRLLCVLRVCVQKTRVFQLGGSKTLEHTSVFALGASRTLKNTQEHSRN